MPDITPEKPWEAILYGYKIDPTAPSFLGRGDRIFEVDEDKDVKVKLSPNPDAHVNERYSDSEITAAEKVATSMEVGGHYGAFSGSASMAVSSSSDSSIKTVRMDVSIQALKYEVNSVGAFRTAPERYLTDNFKEAVGYLTVQQIEDKIGSFYAMKMDLGGEVRKSYTLQATSLDKESSVKSELKAAYGNKMLGVSAKADVGVSTRKSNKNADMKVEWSAKGGDTTLWLGQTFDKEGKVVEDIQASWARSLTDDNLYPFNYELGLMWELVQAVDQKKGDEFKAYLEDKWKKNKNKFVPSKFLPPSEYLQ